MGQNNGQMGQNNGQMGQNNGQMGQIPPKRDVFFLVLFVLEWSKQVWINP